MEGRRSLAGGIERTAFLLGFADPLVPGCGLLPWQGMANAVATELLPSPPRTARS